MATEIRETKWTASEPLDYDAHSTKGFIEVAAPNDACFTALFVSRKDAEDYIAWKESGPECSRLASRVEELENRVAKHSGSLNSADSASSRTSTHAAKETR